MSRPYPSSLTLISSVSAMEKQTLQNARFPPPCDGRTTCSELGCQQPFTVSLRQVCVKVNLTAASCRPNHNRMGSQLHTYTTNQSDMDLRTDLIPGVVGALGFTRYHPPL